MKPKRNMTFNVQNTVATEKQSVEVMDEIKEQTTFSKNFNRTL